MMKRYDHRSITRGLAALVILSAGFSGLQAQTQVPPISTKVPYYINANTASKSEVYDIQDGLLHIQYEDKHGAWKEFRVEVLNWEYQSVGTFVMDKTFGLNHYTVDLQTRLPGLETNKPYFCIFSDEGGIRHEWMFRNIPPVKNNDMTADILVNPIRVKCARPTGNLAEFYSDVRHGTAPYTIRWYVMDPGMNRFLYQPREEQVPLQGKGSMIQVDRAPGYYVIMDVTDACGSQARKMISLNCEELKKKTNTIFVAPFERNTKRLKGN